MYFDNAATTPVLAEILEEAEAYLLGFANPSSKYNIGQSVKDKINQVRADVALLIGASNPENIIFTSGATESNNTAIKGFYEKWSELNHHYITTSVEHPSVLKTIENLATRGKIKATYLPPATVCDLEELNFQIAKKKATFLSVMMVNNETGQKFPIQEIGEMAAQHNCFFHVDATQGISKVKVNVEDLNIDALTFSGHKIFAPKGAGVLYLKDTLSIEPLLHGGGQERGLRCGTENVFAILAMGVAVRYILKYEDKINQHYKACKDYFISMLNQYNIPFHLNEKDAVNSILSIRFPFIKGDALMEFLDFKHNIMISTGSACGSNKKSNDNKTVLGAMGFSESEIRKTVRISFGVHTKMKDIKLLVLGIKNVFSLYGQYEYS